MTGAVFNEAKTRLYLEQMIRSYMMDPPDSAFQAGFLAAVVSIAREAMGRDHDFRLQACDRLIADAPRSARRQAVEATPGDPA